MKDPFFRETETLGPESEDYSSNRTQKEIFESLTERAGNNPLEDFYKYNPAFDNLYTVTISPMISNIERSYKLEDFFENYPKDYISLFENPFSFHAENVQFNGDNLKLERNEITKKFQISGEHPYERSNTLTITWREEDDWRVRRAHEAWLSLIYDKENDCFRSYDIGASKENPNIAYTAENLLYKKISITIFPFDRDQKKRRVLDFKNVLPENFGELKLGWSPTPNIIKHSISYYVEDWSWREEDISENFLVYVPENSPIYNTSKKEEKKYKVIDYEPKASSDSTLQESNPESLIADKYESQDKEYSIISKEDILKKVNFSYQAMDGSIYYGQEAYQKEEKDEEIKAEWEERLEDDYMYQQELIDNFNNSALGRRLTKDLERMPQQKKENEERRKESYEYNQDQIEAFNNSPEGIQLAKDLERIGQEAEWKERSEDDYMYQQKLIEDFNNSPKGIQLTKDLERMAQQRKENEERKKESYEYNQEQIEAFSKTPEGMRITAMIKKVGKETEIKERLKEDYMHQQKLITKFNESPKGIQLTKDLERVGQEAKWKESKAEALKKVGSILERNSQALKAKEAEKVDELLSFKTKDKN